MEGRSGWLLIPAALTLLLALLALVANHSPQAMQDAVGAEPVPAADPGIVVLADADGRRSAPMPWSMLGDRALVLRFDDAFADQDVAVIVRGAGSEPVLQARLHVRADGTLPVGGLPAGSYAVQAVGACGAAAASDAVMPAVGRRSARVVALPAAPVR